MSWDIENAFVKQYGDNLVMLSQQMGSRLRSTVTVKSCTGTRCSWDYLGTTATQPRTGRHGDTPIMDIAHSRRWAILEDHEWGAMIDDVDLFRTLIDPTNPYAQAGAMAAGRTIDDIIIAAADGNAYSGVEGTTTTAWSAVNLTASNAATANTIAHNYTDDATSDTGLSVPKLRGIRTAFEAKESVERDQIINLVVTSIQIQDLLKDDKIINRDYGQVNALVSGQIDTYMGFRFIRSERLGTDGSGYRKCLAYTSDAIGLALAKDPVIEMGKDPSKRFGMRLYQYFTMGAARIQDDKIMVVKCEEA